MAEQSVSQFSRDVLKREIDCFRAAIARLEIMVAIRHEEQEAAVHRYWDARVALKETREELADAIEAYQALKRDERKVS